jgi:hypothetical protein
MLSFFFANPPCVPKSLQTRAEVLADIAEPLLRNIPDGDDAACDGALKAAAVLWNSRLLRIETGHVDPIAELKAALVTPTPPEFDCLYQEVLDRCEMLYPGLDRMIAGVQRVPRPGGGFRIDVASVE